MSIVIANLKSRPGTEVIAEHPKVINTESELNQTHLGHEISLSKLLNAAWHFPNAVTDPTPPATAPPAGDSGSGNVNCRNCVGCDNCRDCVGCSYCKGCVGCTNCTESTMCIDCKDCIRCVSCRDCSGCFGTSGCAGCICGKYEELSNPQETLTSVEAVLSEFPKVIIDEFDLDKKQIGDQISLSEQGETDLQLPRSGTDITEDTAAKAPIDDNTAPAAADEYGNVGCTGCTGCTGCVNCHNCTGCTNCVGCTDCHGCHGIVGGNGRTC